MRQGTFARFFKPTNNLAPRTVNSIFFPVHCVPAFMHVQEHALDAFLAHFARDAVTLRSFASLQPAGSPGWEGGQKWDYVRVQAYFSSFLCCSKRCIVKTRQPPILLISKSRCGAPPPLNHSQKKFDYILDLTSFFSSTLARSTCRRPDPDPTSKLRGPHIHPGGSFSA